jgi:hypothetical protein
MRSDVNGLIEKHPCLAPVAERILAETCVEMQMVRVWDEAVPCGCSRFGGVPDVDSNFVWPQFLGESLCFLFQINCAEVSQFDPDGALPPGGILYFFYPKDEVGRWKRGPLDKGAVCVLYSAAADQIAPANLPEDLQSYFAKPHRRVFLPKASLPGIRQLSIKNLNLSDSQVRAYKDVRKSLPGFWKEGSEADTLLGHAAGHERDMQLQCVLFAEADGDRTARKHTDSVIRERATDWRMLLTFVSADELNWSWRDGLVLHYWIRKQDLQNRKFENVCGCLEQG